MKKIALEPLGESALVATGTPLLAALLAKDLRVLMACGGMGICSTCHVRVGAGMDQLSPVGGKERRTLALVADATPESRLACQATVFGDGVTVHVPAGMYIEKADDLLALLGSRAPANVLHPVSGAVLIPKGKIITRTMLEQSRTVDQEVRRLREATADSSHADRPTFTASGVSNRRALSNTTQFMARGALETKSSTGAPSGRIPRPPGPGDSSGAVTPPPARAPEAPSGPTPAPPAGRAAAPARDRSVASTSVSSAGLVRPTPAPPARPTPPPVHTGAQVGRYLLLECVGKGGAGVVYRALHTTLKTLVAVKFLRPDIGSGDGAAQERLAREAQLLAQLNHPNVVRVLDFEDDPVRPYVVMEFVDGLTAAELIRQSGRLSAGRAVEVALDVAAGLAAAREIGIVHRDVKPGNVLVTRSGASKLVDLGLATVTRPDLAAARPDAPPVEGTVGYMSPEALSAGLVDHRSDVYSLGATLFHLIAGRLPFTGRSAAEVVMKHLRHPPPAVHEFAPETPPQLSAFIQTMMAKDPAARPQTHQEVRAELMGLLHTLGASESAPRG